MAFTAIDVVRVAVVDEHEIFRRGLVACLNEDEGLLVTAANASGPVADQCDVAVVSPTAAQNVRFNCPMVVCGAAPLGNGRCPGNEVLGVLPRATLTPAQLVAAVRAAASGLSVGTLDATSSTRRQLSGRRLEVLRLLSLGADTREIAHSLQYSERTIKALIREIERHLGARNRAQAVAIGIERGMI